MLRHVRSLLELVRFSHTVFALPFALTGAALAWKKQGTFHLGQLVGILLCMLFARSAAMAFNRLVDQDFDAGNPRTAGRHLPAGKLSRAAVWCFVLTSALGFLASTLIFYFGFDNPWPAILAVPVLAYICGYSYAKRFTALAHFWLGTALFIAPVAAWIAIRGFAQPVEYLEPILLGGAVLFWVAGFDILYACQDIDFDRKASLHSVPAAIGVARSLRVAMACHMAMLAMLGALYFWSTELGGIYLIGVGAVALLLGYEHWLVRPDDLSRVNQAFFHVNGVVSIGLFVVVLLQIAMGP